MNNGENELPHDENPETLSELKVDEPDKVAAGVEAVYGERTACVWRNGCGKRHESPAHAKPERRLRLSVVCLARPRR